MNLPKGNGRSNILTKVRPLTAERHNPADLLRAIITKSQRKQSMKQNSASSDQSNTKYQNGDEHNSSEKDSSSDSNSINDVDIGKYSSSDSNSINDVDIGKYSSSDSNSINDELDTGKDSSSDSNSINDEVDTGKDSSSDSNSINDEVDTGKDSSSDRNSINDEVDTGKDSNSDRNSINEVDTDRFREMSTFGDPKLVPSIDGDDYPDDIRILAAIRPSLFPFVPPYLSFGTHNFMVHPLPPEIMKHLKWKGGPLLPHIVRKIVTNSGFVVPETSTNWIGQWGQHMKTHEFRSSLQPFQKYNHLPGTFQLGRKDNLWRNIRRSIYRHGSIEFGFVPLTFVLPQDYNQLRIAWDTQVCRSWIVKPPALSRGLGVKVINKWSQIPRNKPTIVQMYISKPLIVNNRKFDLRLYVMVTSFNPLKIYIYSDGLVRFAALEYSAKAKCFGERHRHITNYSLNKTCVSYKPNGHVDSCDGHKWTLKSLWRHLQSLGINTDIIWEKMKDIVIKTIISAEDDMVLATRYLPNRYNGFELFGFDILIDENLKPWLLEVNISPSMNSSSPLDKVIKGMLIQEVLNIAGYHLPRNLSQKTKKWVINSTDINLNLETPVFDGRLYISKMANYELHKHRTYSTKYEQRDKYLEPILSDLTSDDARHLITAEDELSQCSTLTRIFPTRNTYNYFKYFQSPRYYNMLLDAWENAYHENREDGILLLTRICVEKIHLKSGLQKFANPIQTLKFSTAQKRTNPKSKIISAPKQKKNVLSGASRPPTKVMMQPEKWKPY